MNVTRNLLAEGRALVKRRMWVLIVVVVSIACGGCLLIRAQQDRDRVSTFGRIEGTVRTEHESSNPLVVVLFPDSAIDAEKPEDLPILDHFVLWRPGSFVFLVQPGSYFVHAFEDLNRDGNYDFDEPLLGVQQLGRDPITVEAGEKLRQDLVIPPDGRAANRFAASLPIEALQARTASAQLGELFSVGALLHKGSVVDLQNESFARARGRLAFEQPLEFLIDGGAGIFFTEPFDPTRIPVLFVHGLSGYPQEFEYLIEGLDRDRYQAWFYFYPSGARLDGVAKRGAELVRELQLRHRFRRFALVGHSMGGLVSRSLIFHYGPQHRRSEIPLLVTLSTPWGGDTRAISGVENSPVVIDSWRDMAANSEFLKDLFRSPSDPDRPRRLPDRVAWHMMFSYRGESRGDESTDGTVTLASQLPIEAWEEADSTFPLDYSHNGILRSPEARERLNQLLNATFD